MLGMVAPILSPTTPPPEHVQPEKIYPKSIDEILKGTRFVPVCSSNYKNELSKGKVVLFVYNKGNGIGYRNNIPINFENSKAMAELLRRVIASFPESTGVKFLKFDADCDPQLGTNMYKPLTEAPYHFYGSPQVIIFNDGNEVVNTGYRAPSFEEYVMDEWVEYMRTTLQTL